MSEKNSIDSLINVLNSFRTKITRIRKMCDKPSDFNQNQINALLKEGIFELIEIKKLNEIIQLNCEGKKDECVQIKDNLGKENLDMEKYKYHLDLIKNDISIYSKSPELPESNKVLVDEGKVNNKVEIKSEVFDKILSGRKRLKSQYDDLVKEKKENEEILKSKQKYMKSIPNSIELIERETNKTKSIFDDGKNKLTK